MGEKKPKESSKKNLGSRNLNTRREFSAGGVVFRKKGGKIYWLITKTSQTLRKTLTIWRLPKGWLDDEFGGPGKKARGEVKASEKDLQKAALREVAEEGGVRAKILAKIGTFTWFAGRKRLKFVTFYLMEFLRDLDKGFGPETAEVRWCEFEEGVKLLTFKREQEVLKAANYLLKKIRNSD